MTERLKHDTPERTNPLRRGDSARIALALSLIGLAATGCTSADSEAPIGKGVLTRMGGDDWPAAMAYTYPVGENGEEGTIYCSSGNERAFPKPDVYIVEEGDSLSSFAKNVGLHWSRLEHPTPNTEAVIGVIAAINGIDDEDLIYPGTKLVVPAWCDTPPRHGDSWH